MRAGWDVAVVGAGLAGTASAVALAEAGYRVALLDRGTGGASAIPAAVMAPYPTRPTDTLTRLRARGARYTAALLERLEARGLDSGRFARGAVLLPVTERDRRRHHRASRDTPPRVEHVPTERAEGLLGLATDAPVLLHHDGAAVRPARLAQALRATAGDRLVSHRVQVSAIEHRDRQVVVYDENGSVWGAAGRVVLAAGPATRDLWPPIADRLQPVRGQATAWPPSERSAPLRVAVSGGGYITPVVDGVHWAGATAQTGETDTQLRADDVPANRERLRRLDPAYPHAPPTQHFVGIRVTTADRIPMIERVAARIWVNTGHGAHGLMTAPLAAHRLRRRILQARG